nr:sigma-70 region 4 domain-containing protein [Ectobacillus ponti]
MDKVDHDKVYKLYMDGLTYEQMAKELGISEGSVQKYISRKQFHDPEGWPPRLKRKVKEG